MANTIKISLGYESGIVGRNGHPRDGSVKKLVKFVEVPLDWARPFIMDRDGHMNMLDPNFSKLYPDKIIENSSCCTCCPSNTKHFTELVSAKALKPKILKETSKGKLFKRISFELTN